MWNLWFTILLYYIVEMFNYYVIYRYFVIIFIWNVTSLWVEFTSRVYRTLVSLPKLSSLITLIILISFKHVCPSVAYPKLSWLGLLRHKHKKNCLSLSCDQDWAIEFINWPIHCSNPELELQLLGAHINL